MCCSHSLLKHPARGSCLCYKLCPSGGKQCSCGLDHVLANSPNQGLQKAEWESYTLTTAAGNAKIAGLRFRYCSEVRQDLSVTLKSHPRHGKVLLYSHHGHAAGEPQRPVMMVLYCSELFSAYRWSFTDSATGPAPLMPVIAASNRQEWDGTLLQNRCTETSGHS